MRIKNLIKLRKKAFIISVVAILLVLILPLVSSSTFTPQGDADFRDVYALYNVTDITGSGNIDIDGNITANDITLSGIINISGNITSQNIIPITNNTYDLGSSTSYFKNIYVGIINLITQLTDSQIENDITIRSTKDITTTTNLNTSDLYVSNDADITNDLTVGGDIATTGNSSASWFKGIFNWIVNPSNSDYISFNGTQLNFNETQLNNTIIAIDTATNDSMKSYVDSQDEVYNDSMKAYADSQDTVFNDSMKAYTDGTFITQANEGNLDVNRSDYWDDLNSPSDINAGDITDDGTYIPYADEGDLNVNNSDTSDTATTWDGETSQADLNVNSSDFWDGLDIPTDLNNKLTLDWANITNRFITAVDDIYIYMSGTTATLNETKLNETIISIDTATNTSMKAYVDSQDVIYNDSMKAYADAQDVSYNSTMTSYVDSQDVIYNDSMKNYTDATFITQANEGNLNVNYSNSTSYINWSGILNKFITAVDNVYINMVGTNATFNETLAGTSLAVNSSDYWDDINTPDDFTTVTASGAGAFASVTTGGGFVAGGSTLEEDGDIWMNGSLYLTGNISSVTIQEIAVNGSFYPIVTDSFDLGSSALKWLKGWFVDLDVSNNVSIGGNLSVDGNVGIGTTSPDFKLQVDGDIASETTGTDSIGSSLIRWLKGWFVNLDVSNNVSIGGNLSVDGDGNFTGDVNVDGFVDTKSNYQVSEEGLVLGMNFNSENNVGSAGTETVLDSSVYNNHGTNAGATANSTGGFNGGGAYVFDGSNDYVSISGDILTPITTISMWIKINDFSGTGYIFDTKDTDSKNRLYLLHTGGNLIYGWKYDNVSTDKKRTIALGTLGITENDVWYKLDMMVNPVTGIYQIYVNGVIKDNYSIGAFTVGTIETQSYLGSVNSLGTYFNGSMDDVRIYEKSLSADEIKDLYLQRAEVHDSFVSQSDVYVDAEGDVGIGTRVTTALLNLLQTATTGNTLWAYRDLASGSTDSPVVFIEQDNAGDDQNALKIQQDAPQTALDIDQNGAGRGLNIANSGNQTAEYILQSGVNAANRNALAVYSNAIQINSPLVTFIQDNLASTQPVLNVQQDNTTTAAIQIVQNGHTCNLVVDADGTCDAGTAIGVDNSIALCMVCV